MIFEADIEQLTKVQEFVFYKAQSLGMDAKKIGDLQLAVEEAFVNIIQHGFETTKPEINILCQEDALGLSVIIKDRGKPFNPLKAKIKLDLDMPLQEREEGGLGLYFIRQFVDNLEYSYENGWNVLTMKKLK